jgi:hypothetical protein
MIGVGGVARSFGVTGRFCDIDYRTAVFAKSGSRINHIEVVSAVSTGFKGRIARESRRRDLLADVAAGSFIVLGQSGANLGSADGDCARESDKGLHDGYSSGRTVLK